MNSSRVGKVIIASLAGLVILASIRLGILERGRKSPSRPAESPISAEAIDRDAAASPNVFPARRTAWPAVEALDESSPASAGQNVTEGEEAELPILAREEIERYLDRKQRSGESLLTAFRALNDTNYLREAAASSPGDPRVQLAVAVANAFPEERRKWLDLFKTSAPDNSLANYLSAWEYFEAGQPEEAVNELLEATRKPVFQDYTMDSILALEELSRDAGLSPLEVRRAAMAGWASEHMSELAQLKGLTQRVVGLQKQYQAAGDMRSVEHLSQMGVALAGQLSNGDGARFMMNQLFPIAIEAMSLGQLPGDARYDFLAGKTPRERIEELRQQKQFLRSLVQDFEAVYPRLTDAERFSYSERARLYGEIDAMRWLQQRPTPGETPAPH